MPDTFGSISGMIRRAFPEQPIPEADQIVAGSSGEALEVRLLFMERAWGSISSAEAIENHVALTVFTPIGFRYYCPSFLLAVLEDVREADVMADNLIAKLTLPTEIDAVAFFRDYRAFNPESQPAEDFLLKQIAKTDQRVHRFIDFMSGFTKQQGACINSFLKNVYSISPGLFQGREPLIAAERYWFQFEPTSLA